ncbi:MAG: T9SS type A sorting domain-containing protein, partial [Bacteroidota bacterium]
WQEERKPTCGSPKKLSTNKNSKHIDKVMRLTIVLSLFPFLLAAQFELERAYPTVTTGEDVFSLAWEGGLNSPQPGKADLDGDGRDDLFIFERMGDLPLAFRATPTNYEAAPELLEHWPIENLNGWVVLRDYNQDGAIDIFAYSDTSEEGILVYRGERRPDGLLEFDRITWSNDETIIYFPLQNGARVNLLVSEEDYPEIKDIDCDGDLDILTFNVGGGYVEFYRNTAMEGGQSLETLNFVLEDNCYGGIFEPGISSAVDLAPQIGDCAETPFHEPGQSSGARHAGSTLLCFDEDGDGDLELMLGDVSFFDLNVLTNGGSCDQAWFSDQHQFYPDYDVSATINFFPAGFYLDFNQDGLRDLMAAPNEERNSEDRFSLWYYENVGTDDAPVFSFRNDQAIIDEMIDVGSGSFPAALDADADGDLDLVVSNIDYYTPDLNTNSRLQLFRNIGTPQSPVFQPADEDYLGMSVFNATTSFAFAPTFGDIDQDGDTDALIGDNTGRLFYIENTAGPGNPPEWATPVYGWQDLVVDRFIQPRIVDLDRDGLPDLALGTRRGTIEFFRNIGSEGNPQFNPDIEAEGNITELGDIDSREPDFLSGYASPSFIQDGDDWLIFNMNIDGKMSAYRLPYTNLNAIADTLDAQVSNIDIGEQGTLLMANFDDDPEMEVVLGSLRGGVSYFNSNIIDPTIVSTNEVADRSADISVYPNPATSTIWLRGDISGLTQVELFDLNGRSLRTWSDSADSLIANRPLSLPDLPRGVYALKISGSDWTGVRKIVVE